MGNMYFNAVLSFCNHSFIQKTTQSLAENALSAGNAMGAMQAATMALQQQVSIRHLSI